MTPEPDQTHLYVAQRIPALVILLASGQSESHIWVLT